MNFQENGVIPAVFSTLAVQLDKHTIGSLTLNAGAQTSMSTQIDHSNDLHSISTSFVIGTPHIYFGISYTRKMLDNELKLKLATKYVKINRSKGSIISQNLPFAELAHLDSLASTGWKRKYLNIVQ